MSGATVPVGIDPGAPALLGARVKELRLAQVPAVSQLELATRAGLSESLIKKLEEGARDVGRVATLRLLAAALGTDVPALLAPAGTPAGPGRAAGAVERSAARSGPSPGHQGDPSAAPDRHPPDAPGAGTADDLSTKDGDDVRAGTAEDRRTRLAVLLSEWPMTRYEALMRFNATARALDEDVTVSARQFDRWANGDGSSPRPAAHRVLEAAFGLPAAELLARHTDTPRPYAADADSQHTETERQTRDGPANGGTLLRALLRERHWQSYSAFCEQYDKAAAQLNIGLVGSWPSRPQLQRWLSGSLKGLPYPDHCRVLEAMFPGYAARRLFEVFLPSSETVSASLVTSSQDAVSPVVPVSWQDDGVPNPAFARSGDQAISVEDLADDEVNRRELLRLITVAGSLIAVTEVESLFGSPGSGESALDDLETFEDYGRLNSNLWDVFSLSRSKALTFPLVREQLEVLTTAIEEASTESDRRRLCLLLGNLFQLAGEVLFDLNRYTDAAHCYSLAASASKEARSYDLWSCALTRHSFIGIYDRRFKTAIPLLDAASRVARDGDPLLSTRYWVSVVRAQALAGLGELDACRRALDYADQVRELSGDYQNGGWLRFDGSRLAEERGRCFVELGRPDLAEAALTDALGGSLTARRRGSVLSDLAVLGFQERDRDRIIHYAGQAVKLAEQTRSGVLAKKFEPLRASLAVLVGDTQMQDLSNRIGVLQRRTVTSRLVINI